MTPPTKKPKVTPKKPKVTTPKGWTQPGILAGRSDGLSPQAFAREFEVRDGVHHRRAKKDKKS
jgi:hypothetical protein